MSPVLRRWLESCDGTATVEAAMREALYGSQGYYSQNIKTVGRGGDFSTSATLHRELARAIAAWINSKRDASAFASCSLIEVGAGNGELALGILRASGFWRCWFTEYHIVELSPHLEQLQHKLLKGLPVRWHGSMATALNACDGKAIILSNELVDAFPCVSAVYEMGEWKEQIIQLQGFEVAYGSRELDEERIKRVGGCTALENSRFKREGQQVELHLSYAEWLKTWSQHWNQGSLLTVDYGGNAEEIYARRLRGTLRGYFMQQRFEGTELWERFGKQDLTADVNFEDLQKWGEDRGWKTESLTSQGDFVRRWNPTVTRRAEKDRLLEQWLNLEGAGGAFKVLVQSIQCSQRFPVEA